MTPASSFLDALKLAANDAARAEDAFRRDAAERAKALERERAFAHRRLNFMRAIADVVATAESEEIAVTAATAAMQARLGWVSDSEARGEVLARFETVAQQMFAALAATEDETPRADVMATLAEFESWYSATHPNPFWALFDHYIPETPLVDF